MLRYILNQFDMVSLDVDIGIDLGTANTLIFIPKRGIVLDQPSVVAVSGRDSNRSVLAVGNSAKRMLGRTPDNIYAVRPMSNGVIADLQAAEIMIKYFIKCVKPAFSLFNPRVVIAVPRGATAVERRAIKEAAAYAGARSVYLVEEPIAAALGAFVPLHEPEGWTIVDIGGGTSEVAVLSLGGIVVAESLRVAGDAMDEAICSYVKQRFELLIGCSTAEQVKKKLGTAIIPKEPSAYMQVRGRDIKTGLPRIQEVSDKDIAESLSKNIGDICTCIQKVLSMTPEELSGDITRNGIILTGGGALLGSLDKRIREETGLPTGVAEGALYAVVRGCGSLLLSLS